MYNIKNKLRCVTIRMQSEWDTKHGCSLSWPPLPPHTDSLRITISCNLFTNPFVNYPRKASCSLFPNCKLNVYAPTVLTSGNWPKLTHSPSLSACVNMPSHPKRFTPFFRIKKLSFPKHKVRSAHEISNMHYQNTPLHDMSIKSQSV